MLSRLRIAAALAGVLLFAGCSGASNIPPANGSPAGGSVGQSVVRVDPYQLIDSDGRPVPGTHIMHTFSRSAQARSALLESPMVAAPAPLYYHLGKVQVNPKVYVVFWHYKNNDPDLVAFYLQAFLGAVGGSSWHQTVHQYYQDDVYNKFTKVQIANVPGMLAGTWFDDAGTVAKGWHPSDADVQHEVLSAVSHFGIQHFDTAEPNVSIFIATPHNHSSTCFDNASCGNNSFCAYHSSTLSGAIPYTNFPYMPDAGGDCGANKVNTPGTDDGVSIVAGHELAETETDPYIPSGWMGPHPNEDEIGDICAWIHLQNTVPVTVFGTKTLYPTQPLWSNNANSCWQTSAVH